MAQRGDVPGGIPEDWYGSETLRFQAAEPQERSEQRPWLRKSMVLLSIVVWLLRWDFAHIRNQPCASDLVAGSGVQMSVESYREGEDDRGGVEHVSERENRTWSRDGRMVRAYY